MAFFTLSYDQIKQALLRDIANLLPDASLGEDSDFAVRASGVASAVEGLYMHQAWAARQVFPDTADTDYLERHCSLRHITRKPATNAQGSILFSGAAGANIPLGTEAKAGDGKAYVTTTVGAIGGGGTAAIAAQASIAGSAGNQPNNTPVTLTGAPAGVLSEAIIQTMASGVDAESDASMLARLLDVLQAPPAGGNAADYKRWALEVAGVTSAFVYSLRRGIGTVDIAILSNGGAPAGQLIIDTQAYIDARRPVGLPGANVLVLAPTLVPVAVTAALTLSGATLAAVTALITPALQTYFRSLVPGDTVYRNRIAAIMADTPGVVDFNLTAPVGNTVPLVDATHLELGSLGVVTLT